MKKSIYKVYRQGKLAQTYVTTKRNTEDMVLAIIRSHYTSTQHLKIVRETDKVKTVVFSSGKTDKKIWNLQD
jgi:hypothetical protein